MFHHKKNRINPLLFTFLCSLLIHSPLFLLLLNPSAINTIQEEEDNLVLVEYPLHQQIVSQKIFNKITPKTQTPYLSQADKAVEKETQAMLKGLFYQQETENMDFLKRKSSSKAQFQPDTINRKISSLEPFWLNKITEPIQMNIAEMEKTAFSQRPEKQSISRTMDFLPGVELGSHTLLNTKEFIYYSYFSRMKQQLYWRWTQYFRTEPQLFFLTLTTNEKRQRFFTTRLYVYLSPQGEIQDIRVVKSSGAESIDSAALHAFLSATPFPNPPPELVEEDGYIHIKQSFHLYINPSESLFSRQN